MSRADKRNLWITLSMILAFGVVWFSFISTGEGAHENTSREQVNFVPAQGPCEETFEEASVTDDFDAAEILLERTLRDCDSIDQWWSAAEKFPTAFAGYNLTGNELDLMCDGYPDVGICRER